MFDEVGRFCSKLKSAVYVVVFAKKVRCFEKLVMIYERSDKNETSENIPKPEITCFQ